MKILMLDIETSPNVVHSWGLYQQNIAINQIVCPGAVLCWAAKWHGEGNILFQSNRRGAKRMLSQIHGLLCEADVVVSYNGKRFDIPTLNREFITHGFTPPSPYKQVDLMETAKQSFRFASNKLDFISRQLQLGKKVKHEGHELWAKCMAGDAGAWVKMQKYNQQDVVLLEKLYDKLMPWIRAHPNHGLYEDGASVCVSCGSFNLQRRGWARTQVQKYPRYICRDCGKWNRGAKNELPAVDRKNIMRPDLG